MAEEQKAVLVNGLEISNENEVSAMGFRLGTQLKPSFESASAKISFGIVWPSDGFEGAFIAREAVVVVGGRTSKP